MKFPKSTLTPSCIPTSYATASAGMSPSAHTLPIKLRAIADAGFPFVEIAFPDLEAYAKSVCSKGGEEEKGKEADGEKGGREYREIGQDGEGDVEMLVEVARRVRGMCEEMGLTVLTVMPFSKFEGYEDDSIRMRNLNRAKTWFKVLHALNCPILQVGSSDDPSSSSDFDIIARDLRALADEAAKCEPVIKIAYEMWAWGVHVNSWEDTWEICKRVNRENFGLCLDTFQICALYHAPALTLSHHANPHPLDPHTQNIRIPGGPRCPSPTSSPPTSLSQPQPLTLTNSLRNLTKTIPPEKIFYFQISDAVRPNPVILAKKAEEEGIDVTYAWSNEYRVLPGQEEGYARGGASASLRGIGGGQEKDSEGGGFLEVREVIEAVLATGWRGPWSYEVFFAADMSKEDPDVPKRWTLDAKRCHQRLLDEISEED